MSEPVAPEILHARALLRSPAWQAHLRYLVERREWLLRQPCETVEAMCRREGALQELNRQLGGETFMVEVLKAQQAREAKEAAGEWLAPVPPPPDWMSLHADSEVVN